MSYSCKSCLCFYMQNAKPSVSFLLDNLFIKPIVYVFIIVAYKNSNMYSIFIVVFRMVDST